MPDDVVKLYSELRAVTLPPAVKFLPIPAPPITWKLPVCVVVDSTPPVNRCVTTYKFLQGVLELPKSQAFELDGITLA